jgi:hypothetical protein
MHKIGAARLVKVWSHIGQDDKAKNIIQKENILRLKEVLILISVYLI